jgi:hypothetical protein
MFAPTFFTVLAILAFLSAGGCAIWLMIVSNKKKEEGQPLETTDEKNLIKKLFKIPIVKPITAVVSSFLLFVLSCNLCVSSTSHIEEKKRIAAEQQAYETDSLFCKMITENLDTVSLYSLDKAIEIFELRDWDAPENLRRRGADLHLALADSLFLSARTSFQLIDVETELSKVSLYEPVSQSQLQKFRNLKKKLDRKIAQQHKIDSLKARKQREARLLQDRKNCAGELERMYLDKGMDVTVSVFGTNATTLKIKWILVSKVTAHQFSQDHEFFQMLREKGFKKFIITDGYNDTWSWTL